MKRSLILAVLLGTILVGGCASATLKKVTEPADVVGAVKEGMTVQQVFDHVDTDDLGKARALVTVNVSKWELINDTIYYEPVNDIDAPYYMWLVFGRVGQTVDPAFILFVASRSGADKVVAHGRIPFAEAQKLVERQSGRPLRR